MPFLIIGLGSLSQVKIISVAHAQTKLVNLKVGRPPEMQRFNTILQVHSAWLLYWLILSSAGSRSYEVVISCEKRKVSQEHGSVGTLIRNSVQVTWQHHLSMNTVCMVFCQFVVDQRGDVIFVTEYL